MGRGEVTSLVGTRRGVRARSRPGAQSLGGGVQLATTPRPGSFCTPPPAMDATTRIACRICGRPVARAEASLRPIHNACRDAEEARARAEHKRSTQRWQTFSRVMIVFAIAQLVTAIVVWFATRGEA